MNATPGRRTTPPLAQRKTPTRADVARLAGVSTGTVSHVVHGTAAIRPETRHRVEQAMAELGYVPNVMASGLAGGRSGIIALMFRSAPRTIAGTDLEYALAATDAARELGFHIVLWIGDGEELDHPRQMAGLGLVEGVILMQVDQDDERVEYFQQAGVPVGLIGRSPSRHIAYADADFTQIAEQAIAHVHGLGHRHLALLTVNHEEPVKFGAASHFGQAVEAACTRLGITLVTVKSDRSARAGRQALAHLLETAPDTTCVVSFTWVAAVGLLQEARTRGLQVPRDLSVVLCGNGDPEFTEIELTTVSPPATRIASAAVRAMIDHLRQRTTTPRQVLVPGELVIRASTGPAPSRRPGRSRSTPTGTPGSDPIDGEGA